MSGKPHTLILILIHHSQRCESKLKTTLALHTSPHHAVTNDTEAIKASS